MDLWQMIRNDHANATHLCREIIGAIGEGFGSRERLLHELRAELDRHMMAERDTLYDALQKHESTHLLVGELRHEQAAINAGLDRLTDEGEMDDRDWTRRFEDFTYLLDQHFYREEHELFPAARSVLPSHEVRTLQHAFAREKLAALRAERYGRWGVSPGAILGTLAGAAVVALAAAAWRNSSLRGRRSQSRSRPKLPHSVQERDQQRSPPDSRRLHVM